MVFTSELIGGSRVSVANRRGLLLRLLTFLCLQAGDQQVAAGCHYCDGARHSGRCGLPEILPMMVTGTEPTVPRRPTVPCQSP